MSVPASVDIKNIIESAGLASGAYASWAISIGSVTADPLKLITIYDIGISPPQVAINDVGRGPKSSSVEYAGIRIEVRAPDYVESWQMMNSIQDLFVNNLQHVINDDNSFLYHSMWARNKPFFVGSDYMNRQQFDMVFSCPRTPIVSIDAPSPSPSPSPSPLPSPSPSPSPSPGPIILASRVAVFSGANYLSDAQSVAAWQVTTSKLTLTGAFYVGSVSGTSFLATNFGNSNSTRAYYIRLSSDSTLRLGVWNNNNLSTVDSPAITVGQWCRWVAFIDQGADLAGISINGGAFSTVPFTGTIDTDASSFLLGSLYGNSFFFTGQQSGVGVYKGVTLSQEQALALSNLDESGNAQPIDYSSLADLSANGQDYDMTQNLVEWVQLDDEDNIFRKKVDGLSLVNVNSVTTTPYP